MHFTPLLERLKTAAQSLSPEARLGLGLALLLLVAALVLWRVFARRRAKRPPPGPDLTIDLAALDQKGPPATGPVLELYNVPVRLAALILAPVGPRATAPKRSIGRDSAKRSYRASARSSQPSSRCGAAGQARSASAVSPTPCSPTPACPATAARRRPGPPRGIFKTRGQPLLAGLILRAQSPNSVGHTTIERDAMAGLFRVRDIGLGS